MYILVTHSYYDDTSQMDFKRYDDKNEALSDVLALFQQRSFYRTDNEAKINKWATNTKQAISRLGRCDRATYTLRGEWPVINGFEQIDIAIETDLKGRLSLEARLTEGLLEDDYRATRTTVKLEHVHFAGSTVHIVN